MYKINLGECFTMAKGNSKKTMRKGTGRANFDMYNEPVVKGRFNQSNDDYFAPITPEELEERTKKALALLAMTEESEREIIGDLSTLKIEKSFWSRIIPEIVSGVNDFSEGGEARIPAMRFLLIKLQRAIGNRHKALSYVMRDVINDSNLTTVIENMDRDIESMKSQEERTPESIRAFNTVRNNKFFAELAQAFSSRTNCSEATACIKVMMIIESVAVRVFEIIEENSENGTIEDISRIVEEESKFINRKFMKALDRLNSILEQRNEERISFF